MCEPYYGRGTSHGSSCAKSMVKCEYECTLNLTVFPKGKRLPKPVLDKKSFYFRQTLFATAKGDEKNITEMGDSLCTYIALKIS